MGITSGLVVSGYNVRGRVMSDGEPVKGVSFILYSQQSSVEIKNCIPTLPDTFTVSIGYFRLTQKVSVRRWGEYKECVLAKKKKQESQKFYRVPGE